MKRDQSGFTLMELMVVIVIVAILAAVAVPLYTNYVKDAQRTEAKGAIGAIVSAQQVYLQKRFGDSFMTTITTPEQFRDSLRVDLTEANLNWDFKVTDTGNPKDGFEVEAKGKNGAAGLEVTYKHSRLNGPLWGEK